MTTYRVTVVCKGLDEVEGAAAVADVVEEFQFRPWHTDVSCTWADGELLLAATNDYDDDGMALYDEFWDAVHARVNYKGSINLSVVSVRELS